MLFREKGEKSASAVLAANGELARETVTLSFFLPSFFSSVRTHLELCLQTDSPSSSSPRTIAPFDRVAGTFLRGRFFFSSDRRKPSTTPRDLKIWVLLTTASLTAE